MAIQKIIQYGVATGRTNEEMAGYVNEQIAAGWQPNGSMITAQLGEDFFYHQPMVLHKKPISKKKPAVKKKN